jgi:cytochrome P450/NADPH-cytochrome P450 reductase
MWALADKIVQDRIDHPKPDAKDLLTFMLAGVDSETGEKLSLDNIRYQMVTFLIAGYETTAATLSFTYYYLCSHPEKLLRVQQEVDEVLGDRVITVNMLSKLVYLDACIKEALRITPSINFFNRTATKDTTLAGKYFIKKGQLVTKLLRPFQRDPKIWGEDADEFRPERMLDGGFERLSPKSWKVFGDGLRACLGRGFAEQEMLINIAMVLQKFQVELADPDYKLQLLSTLSIKPPNFKMKARRRQGKSLLVGIPGGGPAETAQVQRDQQHGRAPQANLNGGGVESKPVSVFFGGNTGTSESLAQSLAKNAPGFGLDVSIQNLDAATENLPTDRPCIIITPSYKGRPADSSRPRQGSFPREQDSQSSASETATGPAPFIESHT